MDLATGGVDNVFVCFNAAARNFVVTVISDVDDCDFVVLVKEDGASGVFRFKFSVGFVVFVVFLVFLIFLVFLVFLVFLGERKFIWVHITMVICERENV